MFSTKITNEMQLNPKASCFKGLKAENESFLVGPTLSMNEHNLSSQKNTNNSQESVLSFPSQRMRIYKDLFCQMSNLQSRIAELVSNFPEQNAPNISATICVLEKELICELIINLKQQTAVLNDNCYFQSIRNNCSLERMLHEMSLAETPLVFSGKVELQTETTNIETTDNLAICGKTRQINWKVGDFATNDECEVAAKQASDLTDSVPHKNELKKCLSTISTLFQAKNITQIQKSILKKAVLKNSKQIICQIQLFEKHAKLQPFLEFLENYKKNSNSIQENKN